jgi:hypothetical protein
MYTSASAGPPSQSTPGVHPHVGEREGPAVAPGRGLKHH